MNDITALAQRESAVDWEAAASMNIENQELKQRIAELEKAAAEPQRESRIVTLAAADVLAERQRQQSGLGYSIEQDDTYTCFELSAAAICYIEPQEAENYYPVDWHDDSFKPSDYRRNLVKAGALILAEIERIDRAAGIQVVEGGHHHD